MLFRTALPPPGGAIAAAIRGFRVTVRNEGDAVRLRITLGRERPQVAFIDVVMPGLDSPELSDRITAMPELASSTLVPVTATQDERLESTAAERRRQLRSKPLTIGAVDGACGTPTSVPAGRRPTDPPTPRPSCIALLLVS